MNGVLGGLRLARIMSIGHIHQNYTFNLAVSGARLVGCGHSLPGIHYGSHYAVATIEPVYRIRNYTGSSARSLPLPLSFFVFKIIFHGALDSFHVSLPF